MFFNQIVGVNKSMSVRRSGKVEHNELAIFFISYEE